MKNSSNIEQLLTYYHGGILSHAYLIETNDQEQCLQDLKKLIKQINCPENYQEQCENCNLCNLLENGFLPSFIVIEADGKTIKKEQILDLKSRFSSLPTYTKENIYIIKEAEKLNASSANTMLKFLEEPENHIIGFFITSNQNNCLSTIKSRCEVIHFNYNCDKSSSFYDNPYFDVTTKYIKMLETSAEDTIMCNKEVLLTAYKERNDIENIFQLLLEIYSTSIKEKNNPTDPDFSKTFPFLLNQNITELVRKEKILMKYNDELNYNVNIELFLDKFIIELSGKNE